MSDIYPDIFEKHDFTEEEYLVHERSVFLDSITPSADMPNTFTYFNHHYDKYNGNYGSVCSYRLIDGFFAIGINTQNKTGVDFNKSDYSFDLQYYIFSDAPLTTNTVIGYKKEGCVIQKNGNPLLPDAIEPNVLAYVTNPQNQSDVKELPITLSSLSSNKVAKEKINGKYVNYGTVSFIRDKFLGHVYANTVDWVEPYGGNVQYDRMVHYIKEQLLAFLPKGSDLSNFSLPKYTGTNYFTMLNTRLEHTAFPVFCYNNDEDWYNAVANISNGNWDSPYDIDNKYINWTLYINGDTNASYVLKIDKHNIPDDYTCQIEILPTTALLYYMVGSMVHETVGYTASEGQLKDNTDNLTYIDYDKYGCITKKLNDKYYKFSFADLENELPLTDENKYDGYMILCTFFGKSKKITGAFCIKRTTIKLDLPLTWLDGIIMGGWDSTISNINSNKYSFPMGFIEPYHFDINTNMSYADGTTIKMVFASDGKDDNPDLAEDDDTPKDDIIDTDETTNTLTTASGTLTTTYKIDEFTTKQIGGFLWRKDIAARFELYLNNPIENLLSIKMIPVDAPANPQESIVIGNVELDGIGGREVTSTNVVINIGTVNMSVLNKYGNFIDLPPYTKYVIYLPYIGFREFDGSCCLNKSLNVRYSVDLITGECMAMLYINDKFKVAEYSGNMGIDIPISASNRGNTESALIAGLADSALTLNPITIANSVKTSVLGQYSYQSKGSPSPTCLAGANRTCYVLIDRPQYAKIKSFAHVKGLYCNKTKYIGDCKGFTVCDSNIDLSGINLTEPEIDELRSILSTGFYA